MNNNGTHDVEEGNGLPVVLDGGEGVVEDQIGKQMQAEIMNKKKKKTELRRNEIRTLLNRHVTSIESLRLLSIKEIQQARREENCRAIPEGSEDEGDDDDDDDDDNDNDNKDDSNEKTIILSLSDSSTDLNDSDSNVDYCDCDYNIESGSQQQIEQQQRRNIFYRMKRFHLTIINRRRRRDHHRKNRSGLANIKG